MDKRDNEFNIKYDDLNDEAKARWDQFVRDVGGSEEDVINEHDTESIAVIEGWDLDLPSESGED